MTAERIASLSRATATTAAASGWQLRTNSIVAVFRDRRSAFEARHAIVATGAHPGYIVDSHEAGNARGCNAPGARFLTADVDLDEALVGHARAGETLLVVPGVGRSSDAMALLQHHSAHVVYRRGRWVTERVALPATAGARL